MVIGFVIVERLQDLRVEILLKKALGAFQILYENTDILDKHVCILLSFTVIITHPQGKYTSEFDPASPVPMEPRFPPGPRIFLSAIPFHMW
jgi:hypothetical protein